MWRMPGEGMGVVPLSGQWEGRRWPWVIFSLIFHVKESGILLLFKIDREM
jgi:hypothetical protein